MIWSMKDERRFRFHMDRLLFQLTFARPTRFVNFSQLWRHCVTSFMQMKGENLCNQICDIEEIDRKPRTYFSFICRPWFWQITAWKKGSSSFKSIRNLFAKAITLFTSNVFQMMIIELFVIYSTIITKSSKHWIELQKKSQTWAAFFRSILRGKF